MPIDQWPCIPENFSSILPPDLPPFFQAGVNHILHRAVSIVDPLSEKRIDSLDPFDNYQPFCLALRTRSISEATSENWNENCKHCDFAVAKYLINKANNEETKGLRAFKYRCYMGLSEIATVISVGGLKIAFISGQFLPKDGKSDISKLLAFLGTGLPQKQDVSEEMWRNIAEIGYPPNLWSMGPEISPQTYNILLALVEELEPFNDSFEIKFLEQAKRIQDIVQKYYEMERERVEDAILRDLTLSLTKAYPSKNNLMWGNIKDALRILNTRLGFQYSVFWAGNFEKDTLLRMKVWDGQFPKDLENEKNNIHFNWRKAGILTNDERDINLNALNWDEVNFKNSSQIFRGFKGIINPLDFFTVFIPVKLPQGPFGLLTIGPQLKKFDLQNHEEFITTVGRDFSTRALTLLLSNIVTEDRENWERTARLSGHRVRSALQGINSQIRIIRDFYLKVPGFTQEDKIIAEKELNVNSKNLIELSYAAESNIPGTLDVRSVKREVVHIAEIVNDALVTQQDLADEHGIVIDNSPKILLLPRVKANRTLLRSAFINLINNGLKYSYPTPENKSRILTIKPSTAGHNPKEIWIEIVNYGLGVKEEDKERIFEWGVRLADKNEIFKGLYGKGIGLWEVKYIITGHGGRILVSSNHYSKAPVSENNINQCITVFTVVLPVFEA